MLCLTNVFIQAHEVKKKRDLTSGTLWEWIIPVRAAEQRKWESVGVEANSQISHEL